MKYGDYSHLAPKAIIIIIHNLVLNNITHLVKQSKASYMYSPSNLRAEWTIYPAWAWQPDTKLRIADPVSQNLCARTLPHAARTTSKLTRSRREYKSLK